MKKFLIGALLLLVALPAMGTLSRTTHIIATAGPHGTVSPSDTVAITIDTTQQVFNFYPASGFKIDSVIVNGVNVGTASSYTYSDTVDADTSVYSTLKVYFYSSHATVAWQASTLKLLTPEYMVKYYTYPNYQARDSVVYTSPVLAADLGGRHCFAGAQFVVPTDTVSLYFVLEASLDTATWYLVDSVQITTNHTVAQKWKNFDLDATRYPYYRFRYGTSTSKLYGDRVFRGEWYFFVVTNVIERL